MLLWPTSKVYVPSVVSEVLVERIPLVDRVIPGGSVPEIFDQPDAVPEKAPSRPNENE